MTPKSRVLVLGARGLVGSAIVRRLRADDVSALTPGRADLDVCDARATDAYFAEHRPEYVFLAAAKVGGIQANATAPADFIKDNLLIQAHAIDAAWRFGATKLLFLGSSCIYPKLAPQPMAETALLTGLLEPSNQPYAIAKIAGLEMVAAYRRQHGFNGISLMPTNLYGPNDNFDLETSHVLAALLRRFHEAKMARAPRIVIWGTGTPRREFLHVDDLADACVFMMRHHDGDELVNIGTGIDLTIAELAALLAEITGFEGKVEFDAARLDGTPRKLLDVSRARKLGWSARTSLREGVAATYAWYLEHGPARPSG